MDFMKPITVFITSIFTRPMVDSFMVVAPLVQSAVNVVFIGKYQGSLGYTGDNNRFDARLLHIGQHFENDFTAPLGHPENGWFLFGQRAASTTALETSASAVPAFRLHFVRPTFVSSYQIHFIELHLLRQDDWLILSTIPVRSCPVISWTSSLLRPSSLAIC